MSFISVFYLVFLALSASIFYALPHRCRVFWLLFVSYFFYFTWQPVFVFVLSGETFAAYWFGRRFADAANRTKRWLTTCVVFLLLPLAFFKYYNVLNASLSRVLAHASLENPLSNQPYLIPLGISFFTFLAISYVADIYRGYLKPEPRFENVALYMAFFPTILAGPIERAKSMLRQFNTPVRFEYANIRIGLQLILWGAFKKVVLADRMKDLLDKIYGNPHGVQGLLVYFALAFSVFQLFCDFSAYSDIAVGSARMFGFTLTKNFDDRVYAASSRTIFWQGWHRSLTAWLREYVFLPLSRHSKTKSRLYVNVLIVYLLVGVWHGATMGFLVWGILNGVWLILEHSTKKKRDAFFTHVGLNVQGRVYNLFAWLFIFHVGIGFAAFFRTDTLEKAFGMFASLANSNQGLLDQWETKSCLMTIGFLIFMDVINRQIPPNANFDAFIGKQVWWLRWGLYVLLSQLIIRYVHVREAKGFMYYNF